MARKIVQQTGDGVSAEYDHWATEDQMERLIKSLTSNGLRASDINNIVAQLEKMNNGDKVDRGILKQTLANDRREAMQDRK